MSGAKILAQIFPDGITSAGSTVQPPTTTTVNTPSGSNFALKTFGAFTDADSVIDSYTAVVTNSSGTASWTDGAGNTTSGPYTPTSSDGDSGVLALNALDSEGNIVATAIHAYDRDPAAGTGSWQTQLDIGFSGVTNAGPFSNGTNTFAIGAQSIDITTTRFSSGNGTIEGVNGTGLVITNSAGTYTVAMDFVAKLASWARLDLHKYKWAVHIVVESLAFTTTGDSLMCGVSTNTTHNSGDSRVFYTDIDGTGPITERWRTRNNTANSTTINSLQATRGSRVITTIIGDGSVIEVMDTSGTTIPTPAPGDTLTYTVGSDAVGQLDSTPQYLNCYSVSNFGLGTTATITRLVVQRYN